MEHFRGNLNVEQIDELILKLEQAKIHLQQEIAKKDVELMEKEQEIKYLKNKIGIKNENGNNINSKSDEDRCKELEESIASSSSNQLAYQEMIDSYVELSRKKLAHCNILQNEVAENKIHLARTEREFIDLLQKYENAKAVIEGLKRNEYKLKVGIVKYEETLKEQTRRSELLEAHSNAGLERGSSEMLKIKTDMENEITRLTVIRKKLEHVVSVTKTSLEQKTKECSDLAGLREEWAGMKKF